MCCKKYKVEKPVYDPSEATHEKIDKRALPLSGKFKGIITIKSGDTTITWQKFALRYQEYRWIGDSPYSTFKWYNNDGNLTYVRNIFQNKITIGWEKEYDDKGNLVKKQNLGADFKFTVDSLIIKMKKEYNMDLTKQVKLPECVERMSHQHGHGVWLRYVIMKKIGIYYHKIEIDGQQGYVIRDKILYAYGRPF